MWFSDLGPFSTLEWQPCTDIYLPPSPPLRGTFIRSCWGRLCFFSSWTCWWGQFTPNPGDLCVLLRFHCLSILEIITVVALLHFCLSTDPEPAESAAMRILLERRWYWYSRLLFTKEWNARNVLWTQTLISGEKLYHTVWLCTMACSNYPQWCIMYPGSGWGRMTLSLVRIRWNSHWQHARKAGVFPLKFLFQETHHELHEANQGWFYQSQDKQLWFLGTCLMFFQRNLINRNHKSQRTTERLQSRVVSISPQKAELFCSWTAQVYQLQCIKRACLLAAGFRSIGNDQWWTQFEGRDTRELLKYWHKGEPYQGEATMVQLISQMAVQFSTLQLQYKQQNSKTKCFRKKLSWHHKNIGTFTALHAMN